MFTREELNEKKKIEIMSIAKDLGLPRYKGKSELSKDVLINSIMEAEENDGTQEAASVSNKKTEQVKSEVKAKKEPEPKKQSKVVEETKKLQEKKRELTEEERTEKKLGYIEGAKVGTLVAFKSDTGKVKSAMIVKRSTKNRKFKLETRYGAQFIVSFDDVVWVRTNKRWPKGVYQLLKGIDESEVNDDAERTEEVHS